MLRAWWAWTQTQVDSGQTQVRRQPWWVIAALDVDDRDVHIISTLSIDLDWHAPIGI